MRHQLVVTLGTLLTAVSRACNQILHKLDNIHNTVVYRTTKIINIIFLQTVHFIQSKTVYNNQWQKKKKKIMMKLYLFSNLKKSKYKINEEVYHLISKKNRKCISKKKSQLVNDFKLLFIFIYDLVMFYFYRIYFNIISIYLYTYLLCIMSLINRKYVSYNSANKYLYFINQFSII